ncbi:CYTH domain-containing protein [Mannheimia sp. AT1]|uniref:CYTH domain-containing protein n=1 Tax=Mannheimia cairinae TaxID=3025936 RepID=A0ABT5MT91_9PAST|nr:CYTH domain-containing protein [Mannheimia cairinae]MDD0824691.1 CYTH domain-containing protein [Mannheimia cairinae]MDD0826380.1 CYTH domain-containing protein [Mannheimia cairinae]
MENKQQAEIELKIMLDQQNIPLVENWLNNIKDFTLLAHKTNVLGNAYYDTPEQLFAQQKMGLRVRSQNNQFEITLKTKGEIVGGLHIRPEYNLELPNNQPDFMALVAKYNLPFENAEEIAQHLQPTFSTNFTRQTWLIKVDNAEIEVALDQGLIKNAYGEEPICELEFEIKQGSLADLFTLVEAMPKADGMWLSGLSKAQRGYLVGQAVKFEQEIAKALQGEDSYLLEQKLADFIRVANENKGVLERFERLTCQQFSSWDEARNFAKSKNYLISNLAHIRTM